MVRKRLSAGLAQANASLAERQHRRMRLVRRIDDVEPEPGGAQQIERAVEVL
jgi:hypothetical protein